MHVHLVIPARFASTRLPAKPLADIDGKPMIERVMQRAQQVQCDDVIAAVDHVDVEAAVRHAGFQAMMTSTAHESGSDRVLEVVTTSGWQDDDIVVNVQGDEPLFPVACVDDLISFMRDDPRKSIATISEPIELEADFANPNVVKVVADSDDRALYFSRAPIPFARELTFAQLSQEGLAAPRRHVGIYAFRVATLRQCAGLPVSRLERIEKLEQLRWMEHGFAIYVKAAREAIPGGVDTIEDLQRVNRVLRQASG